MQKSTEEKITDYLDGDSLILSDIIRENLDLVYNFVFHMVRDKAIAEDLTQETFIKVWKNIKKYKKGSRFLPWLFTIARNTTFDFLKKKKDVLFSAFEDEKGENYFVDNLESEADLPEEVFSKIEDVEIVRQALEKISPEKREVLLLRNSTEMTFDEIGVVVRRPLHTVKSQYRRGMGELKKQLM